MSWIRYCWVGTASGCMSWAPRGKKFALPFCRSCRGGGGSRLSGAQAKCSRPQAASEAAKTRRRCVLMGVGSWLIGQKLDHTIEALVKVLVADVNGRREAHDLLGREID